MTGYIIDDKTLKIEICGISKENTINHTYPILNFTLGSNINIYPKNNIIIWEKLPIFISKLNDTFFYNILTYDNMVLKENQIFKLESLFNINELETEEYPLVIELNNTIIKYNLYNEHNLVLRFSNNISANKSFNFKIYHDKWKYDFGNISITNDLFDIYVDHDKEFSEYILKSTKNIRKNDIYTINYSIEKKHKNYTLYDLEINDNGLLDIKLCGNTPNWIINGTILADIELVSNMTNRSGNFIHWEKGIILSLYKEGKLNIIYYGENFIYEKDFINITLHNNLLVYPNHEDNIIVGIDSNNLTLNYFSYNYNEYISDIIYIDDIDDIKYLITNYINDKYIFSTNFENYFYIKTREIEYNFPFVIKKTNYIIQTGNIGNDEIYINIIKNNTGNYLESIYTNENEITYNYTNNNTFFIENFCKNEVIHGDDIFISINCTDYEMNIFSYATNNTQIFKFLNENIFIYKNTENDIYLKNDIDNDITEICKLNNNIGIIFIQKTYNFFMIIDECMMILNLNTYIQIIPSTSNKICCSFIY